MASCSASTEVVNLIKKTAKNVIDVKERARMSYEENPNDFVEKNYGVLGRVIHSYAELFQGTGCKSLQELEDYWRCLSTDRNLRQVVEELVAAEEQWDNFLMGIDDWMEGLSEYQASTMSQSIIIGSNAGNSGILLSGADDGKEMPISKIHVRDIEACTALFSSLECGVHVIYFGSPQCAVEWRNQTNCTFPMWRDSDRKLYRALGFKRSLFQVWRAETMAYYGNQMSQNVELPKALPDCEDDPLQMAGTVVLDSKCNVVYLHASQHPADRPNVETLLVALRKIET